MSKILIINTVPTDRNGITNVIFSYFCPMLKEKFVLDYVSINEMLDCYVRKVSESGGKYYIVPRSARTLAYYFSTLWRLISQNHYDAVHIHGNSHTVVLELMAAFLAKCKVRIVHAHATSSKSLLLHRILAPLFDGLCNCRLACNDRAGKWMFGNHPFEVIHNGVDTMFFAFNQEARDDLRKNLSWVDKVILAHVGEFSANKNQTFLVDVLSVLKSKCDNYCLLLIGDGELKQFVEQKVKQQKLEGCVYFAGKVSDVDRYLSAADCILMPSFHEGLPLTLVEQQSNGLRCIISDSISREANITGNITYLPLCLNKWVDMVRTITIEPNGEREKRSIESMELLKKAGYDVRSSVESLRQYYLNSINNIK